MLPRHLRLTKNADILKAIRQGNKISTPHVLVYFLQRDDNQPSRAACVVSKKVHQSAVKRHRYQRWLRHLSGEYITLLPASHDTVWVAKPSIIEVKEISKLQSSLQGQVSKLIKQLKKASASQPSAMDDSLKKRNHNKTIRK